VKAYHVRSVRTGAYHSRLKSGALGLAPLSPDATPVRLTRALAVAAKKLLKRKFKMDLEIIEAKGDE
jgi:hypothetical protein